MFSRNQAQQTQSTSQHFGYLYSHSSFPANYTPNIDVTYNITGLLPRQQQLVLVFFKFDVEGGTTACNYDTLFVNGVQDSTGVEFCQREGYTPPLNQRILYNVTAPTVSFRFKTDFTMNRKGFFFNYTGNK